MSPHERILATINRQPVDRIPVDIWLTPEVLDSLRAHTGVQDEYEIYRTLGVDKIAWIFPGYRAEKFDPNEGEGMDPWGVPLKKVRSGRATYRRFSSTPTARRAHSSHTSPKPGWTF
jgi:uroporphyrinogen decarboxylase